MRRKISTQNILRSGPGLPLSNASLQKSNNELVTALRYALRQSSNSGSDGTTSADGSTNGDSSTAGAGKGEGARSTTLKDEASEYDVTAKIFFTPHCRGACRGLAVDEAIGAVLEALGIPAVELFIMSFPGIALDADDTDAFTAQELDDIAATYSAAEQLVRAGRAKALGVAELSAAKLKQLCDRVAAAAPTPASTDAGVSGGVKPAVDQINLKDCCVMPRDLVSYAKAEGIKLYTHGDASDILPQQTLTDLLADARDPTAGQVDWRPRWVCKYTAVVKSRGVVESKGYVVSIGDS